MPNNIFIMENNQRVGPLTEAQLWEMVRAGRVQPATYCWYEGLPGWKAFAELYPQPSAAPAPAPAPVPMAAPGAGTRFEIVRSDVFNMPKIALSGAEVVLESGALHYMIGQIEMQAEMPSVGGFLKSALTKEHAVKPRYRGTGDLFIEPTFWDCNILELKGEEWILDKGCFRACDSSVQVDMFTNKAWSGLFGGEGFFQTRIAGYGKVIYTSQGPVQKIELNGETLVVDGSFAVARSSSLDYRLERSSGRLLGSFISGEGMVSTFRGRGTVLLSPVPNRYVSMVREFGGIHSAISRIKSG